MLNCTYTILVGYGKISFRLLVSRSTTLSTTTTTSTTLLTTEINVTEFPVKNSSRQEQFRPEKVTW